MKKQVTDKKIDDFFEQKSSIREMEKGLIKNNRVWFESADCSTHTESSALWINLSDKERVSGSLANSRGKIDEDPCFALADFLESQLSNKVRETLHDRGCTIQVVGNTAQICISASVSLEEVKKLF